jgi:DNA-binding CsgD family transcriptional regulator
MDKDQAAARGEQATAAPSARELEVLVLVADGLTDGAIGTQLIISPHTVSSHVRSVTAKLCAANRAHTVSLALRRGLIQ